MPAHLPDFADARGGPRRVEAGIALLLAAGLHLSLLLLPAPSPAPPSGPSLFPLDLRTVTDVETAPQQDAPRELTPEPEPERTIPVDYEPASSEHLARDTALGADGPGDASGSGDDAESANPGEEGDEAAPLLTSGLSDSDWSLLSGQGSTLGGTSLAGTTQGGAATRATSLAARDLSRDAIAPDLAPLLLRNYPPAARMARAEGSATVEAVISAKGAPSDVRVRSVTPRGRQFGETCTRTVLQGPRWKPRLNQAGRPIESKVRYTCNFVLPEELKQGAVPGETSGTGANRIWTKPAR